MALKHATKDATEVFLQNENLQTENHIGAHISNLKTYKGNSCGIKYGLSELSNDKTYLETELPARKRFKSEAKLFNTMKCLNKIYKAIGNDDESTNEEKYSGEISNIESGEQGFQNNLPAKELLKSDLNAEINQQNESSVNKFSTCNSVFQNNIIANQFKLNSNELNEMDFEKKLESHEYEINSENNIYKNLDNDKILNQGTGFDDEVNKCCKLLNLDVSKTSFVSRSDTKTSSDNFGKKCSENSDIHKCGMGNLNYKNQNSDILHPKLSKLVTSLKSMSNDENINLETDNLGKKLEMLDEEKSCDNIKFKDEGNLALSAIISNSSSMTRNKNCSNKNDQFFHGEIQDNNSFESEFNHNDKCNSEIKLKNNLNLKKSSVRKPNIFIPTFQNHDNKSNTKHLNLTIEDTLNSDILKFQETNHNVSQVNLNADKDEVSPIKDVSEDILILYNESDIDFDEINASESAHTIMEETSKKNQTVFHANLENDSKTNRYIHSDVEKQDNFNFNEKSNPLKENNPLDHSTYCESSIFDGISNNNFTKNKNDFDVKLNESFVSEYEISLLAEDTDSILSDESLDSEYEISLLEDGISDEDNQNDVQENKSDSNVGSRLLIDDEKEEKIANVPHRDTKKIKMEAKNEKISDKINRTDEIVSNNKIYSNDISERNIASCPEEKFPSNNQIVTKTDFNVKLSVQKKVMQISSKNKSNENTNDKTEQNFTAITDGMVILKPKQPVSLKAENPDIFKKELSENSNDSHYQIKSEINNESHTSNKVKFNKTELKNLEEKAADKPITEKFIKLEMDAVNTDESKQNINKEFQSSNEVVFKSKKNEIRKNKEIESVAIIKKHITESSITDKVICEKTVKTDLKASTSGKLKQDEQIIIPDYYEEEKEDLINPGWNKIKELSTDEERYRQVRDCWKSKNIPNPFKNLTYYSYRKRKITSGENNTRQTKQHKRHASTNLNDKNAKRSRSCTYIFDDRIKSIQKEKEMTAKTLQEKMLSEVGRLNELQYQREMGLQNVYGFNFDPRRQFQLNSLISDYEQKVLSLTAEYEQKVNDCCDQYTTEINSLKNSRNEVLQFYSFYKGLNTNEYKDPTVLTNAQIQELEEIENIYNQMDLQYR